MPLHSTLQQLMTKLRSLMRTTLMGILSPPLGAALGAFSGGKADGEPAASNDSSPAPKGHPMGTGSTPKGGQGLAVALEDAAVLGWHLKRQGLTQQALHSYERERPERVRTILVKLSDSASYEDRERSLYKPTFNSSLGCSEKAAVGLEYSTTAWITSASVTGRLQASATPKTDYFDMAVCLPSPSFELLDCQGTVLRHVPTACLDEQTLKELAEVFESDKKAKIGAEFPEFGTSGASAYLAFLGGDYNGAREMLLTVQQRFMEQNAQHIHQLEADLQGAQQATEQAQFERDGAVADANSAIAECVHLTQQRDRWAKMVQENETFKAEAQRANIKLHAMEVKCQELQREYQDVHGFIATLEREHYGKLAECQAQTVNLQSIAAELTSEAAADMGHKVEMVRVRGLLDDKQQEIEALECRLANSQAELQLKEHDLVGTHTRLQALQDELSDTQERLEGKVEQLEATVERTVRELSQMVARFTEVEGMYFDGQEIIVKLHRAVVRRKEIFDNMFDSVFKEKLDLIGENELWKHHHAVLEQKLESTQRELDISNQWLLEANEELDEVTDELTLFKETLHAQGLRLPNGDPFVVSHPPLGLEE
ncbi:hypothetical protein WJX77_001790 [Trebouxia sp. C0004]